MKPAFLHASEAFRRLNPHLFGAGGGLPSAEPQRASRPLHQVHPGQESGQGSLGQSHVPTRTGPLARVCLLALRHRLLDADNLAASFKFLQDCVADTILPGLAPGRADAFFQWEYAQHLTRGPQLTLVLIQTITTTPP